MADDQVDQETLNPDAEAGETAETSQDENQEEEVDAKLKKAEEYAQNQKIRAEKAEQKLKALEKNKVEEKETPKNDMSLKDIRALSDVHDDDVDDLIDYAKYKGITIAEAKKTPAMVSLLKAKAEERAVAQAANTGGGKRGTAQPSDEQILSEAEMGKEVDPDKLAEARSRLRKEKKI